MRSTRPVAAFSGTKCTSPTIPLVGTICLWLSCLTIWMNLSIQSAQPCGSLYDVEVMTTYSGAWGCNTHSWVMLHLGEKVGIVFPESRCCWNWKIWFGGVWQKYETGKVGICPRKELLRSFSWFSTYWMPMIWDSGIIPWLAFGYCNLQSCPRHSIKVGVWNGWW